MLKKLKIKLINKYKIKDLKEMKIIICQNIIQDLVKKLFKQISYYLSETYWEKKHLTNCNTFNIFIKVNIFIKMIKTHDYKKVNLIIYQNI